MYTVADLQGLEQHAMVLHGPERKKAVRQLRALQRKLQKQNDPQLIAERNARRKESARKALERRKERRRTDPEFREKLNAQYRAFYHKVLKHRPDQNEKQREYNRKRRADIAVKPKLLEYLRRYTERHRLAILSRRAGKRAAKMGIPYDMDFLTEIGKTHPEFCACCGVKLNYAYRGQHGRPIWDSPSLDRIDPTKGYTRGNVDIICWRCNALKRDAMLHEFEMLVAYMKARL